ncbi:hypothetical protein CRUP_016271, partial [Coryphaenoides rupestris]
LCLSDTTSCSLFSSTSGPPPPSGHALLVGESHADDIITSPSMVNALFLLTQPCCNILLMVVGPPGAIVRGPRQPNISCLAGEGMAAVVPDDDGLMRSSRWEQRLALENTRSRQHSRRWYEFTRRKSGGRLDMSAHFLILEKNWMRLGGRGAQLDETGRKRSTTG